MRAGRLCDFCLEREADHRYREVIGFERLRTDGGANAISARRETGRRICMECLRAAKGGDLNVRPQKLPGLVDCAP